MIRLRTLGTLDLRGSDGAELRPVLSQTRRLGLLLYLAIATPRGFHRRDKLLALFWPDLPIDRARASLSRAIYFLRRHLGSETLISRTDDDVGLRDDRFWSDAAAFEQTLAAGDHRQALELYGGDLLPGFFISDAPGFEEWLEAERARLTERASGAAWTLADHDEGAGKPLAAVQWARKGLELSPFRETGLRRLLALLDRVGDRAGAGQAYRQFERQLAAELELSPSPETRALIEAIRARDQAAAPSGLRAAASTIDPSPHQIPSAIPHSPPTARPRRRSWLGLASAALLLFVAALAIAPRLSRPDSDPRLVYLAPPATGVDDEDLAQLGRSSTERIIESLTRTGLVRIAAPASRSPAATLGRPASIPPNAARAGSAVSVALHRGAGRVQVQAWITDVRRRQIVWAVPPVAAPLDSARQAIDEVARRVAGAVAALTMPRFASWFPVASSPPTFEAFQEFASGVDLQSRRADRDAVARLERAVELDPTFMFARLQLAAAYLSLFDSHHADPLTTALGGERARLNPLQSHWLDWMLAIKVEDQLAGYRALAEAAQLAPDRFLLDLARSAYALNRPREAVRVLERLGPDSPYNGGTREYWRSLTLGYHALGDYRRELAAARRSRKYLDPPIAALAFECNALAAMGRVGEVTALLDTTLSLPPDRGTSPRQLMAESGMSPAQVMVMCAQELRAHGFERVAMETLGRALAWYRAQPAAEARERVRRVDVGFALYLTRKWEAADSIFRSLVAEDPGNFVYQGFLGTVAAQRGDQAMAQSTLSRFDSLRTSLPMPHTSVGYWQSKIVVLLGDEARALTLLAESIGPQGRQSFHAEFEFQRIWHKKAFRDFVRPKG